AELLDRLGADLRRAEEGDVRQERKLGKNLATFLVLDDELVTALADARRRGLYVERILLGQGREERPDPAILVRLVGAKTEMVQLVWKTNRDQRAARALRAVNERRWRRQLGDSTSQGAEQLKRPGSERCVELDDHAAARFDEVDLGARNHVAVLLEDE